MAGGDTGGAGANLSAGVVAAVVAAAFACGLYRSLSRRAVVFADAAAAGAPVFPAG